MLNLLFTLIFAIGCWGFDPTGYAQVLAEYASVTTDAAPARAYTFGHDLIAQRRNTGSSGSPSWTTSYYGYDGHGSVRMLLESGSSAAITDTYDYDAWGTLLARSGSTPNAYRYAGEQWDDDLGMYFLRARYYRPDSGRFWTMDSFEGHQTDPLSLHKYLYCHANPVNGIDPSGNMTFSDVSVAMGKMFTIAAVHLGRATPVIHKATLVVFEATTGNTVFVGGAGAIVALKAGTPMGGVSWSSWQRIGNILKGRWSVGTFDELSKGLKKSGDAANHLNQAAAFPRIPHGEGVAVASRGSGLSRATDHGKFHEVLE